MRWPDAEVAMSGRSKRKSTEAASSRWAGWDWHHLWLLRRFGDLASKRRKTADPTVSQHDSILRCPSPESRAAEQSRYGDTTTETAVPCAELRSMI